VSLGAGNGLVDDKATAFGAIVAIVACDVRIFRADTRVIDARYSACKIPCRPCAYAPQPLTACIGALDALVVEVSSRSAVRDGRAGDAHLCVLARARRLAVKVKARLASADEVGEAGALVELQAALSVSAWCPTKPPALKLNTAFGADATVAIDAALLQANLVNARAESAEEVVIARSVKLVTRSAAKIVCSSTRITRGRPTIARFIHACIVETRVCRRAGIFDTRKHASVLDDLKQTSVAHSLGRSCRYAGACEKQPRNESAARDHDERLTR
jgi:hypothetical protein